MIIKDKSTYLCLAFVFASRLFLQGFGYPGEGRGEGRGVGGGGNYIFYRSLREIIRIHLRETATNSETIHSLARKNEHLRINQIQ